jgi:adenylate cyclase
MKLMLVGPHSFTENGEGRWLLREDSQVGAAALDPKGAPFVIGRSKDCHLVLPDSDRLRAQTSRWHCHLLRDKEGWLIVDGGLTPVPDTGRPKPSISGTLVNGTKISEPTRIYPGDRIDIGPFRIEAGEVTRDAIPVHDPSSILNDVAKGESRLVQAGDPKLTKHFGQLHELVLRLAKMPDIEESLATLLSYLTSKIEGAEVAAILLTRPDGGFDVRMARDKSMGKILDFSFSVSLLKSLPPDRAFLLSKKLTDQSESQCIQDISSGLLVPLWGKGDRLGVLYMDNRRRGGSFSEEDLYLGSALASLISLQLTLKKQADLARIEDNMARYFAPDVVQRIVDASARDDIVGLEVQEKDVTVLFVDMESFTALSQEKTPKEISEILNPYLETVARCIQDAGGHVNKFIGDAVMGIFGAQPGEEKKDPALYASQAIRAALAIPEGWTVEAERRHLPKTRVRIGINSGRAVVGNIGYSSRLEYSVLGDTVNLASRLEKEAAPNSAAVSQATRDLVDTRFEFEELGERDIKGVGKIFVFSPVGERSQSKPA